MHDPAHRFSLLAVVNCGLLNVALFPWNSSVSALWDYSNGVVVRRLLQRRTCVLDLINVAVAFVLALKLTAIRTAILRKLAYIGLVSAQAAAVAIHTREPCHEARWPPRAAGKRRSDASSANRRR
jgi:hypothetical protein